MPTLDDLLARAGRRLVGPLGFWHAAALEQLPEAAALGDPDAAARALTAAVKLYDLDVVVAAPVEAVAWAVRGAGMPGAPVAAAAADHRARRPLSAPPDVDAVATAPATGFLEGLVARLRTLTASGVHTAVAVPTAASLAASLGPAVGEEWADDAVGAVLRAVGAAEPDVVLRVGDGDRAGVVPGLCGFFDLALVEVLPGESGPVSGPTGEEFVAGSPAAGRLVTTTTELPATADPKEVAARVRSLHAEGGR
ncbi:MAG TPA: hypothetical protein VKZ81_11530 [Pseudonocardia sp.]|jgi:hypothetical protein|uniref:hypothetical protein n=1 Tax=Pseudonocardia sp. TaxID=60912 RepID=UPI002B4B0178|nr:hypothetical protein [Pseudonocardia sp.]HLU56083.1 hypothetical protein [Pseudonocardia sp.]